MLKIFFSKPWILFIIYVINKLKGGSRRCLGKGEKGFRLGEVKKVSNNFVIEGMKSKRSAQSCWCVNRRGDLLQAPKHDLLFPTPFLQPLIIKNHFLTLHFFLIFVFPWKLRYGSIAIFEKWILFRHFFFFFLFLWYS